MLDGTYTVNAKTPFGAKGGTLVLTTEGSACFAKLSIGEKTANLEGTVNGEEVTFTGSVKLPFPVGKMDYSLVGTVVGDELKGVCTAKKFKFDVTGTRVA